MATVELNGAVVHDWNVFHTLSQQAFGFPEFYGRNGNAWIDCLSYLDEDDGMSRFVLAPDEHLDIVVQHTAAFEEQAPEVLAGLAGLTAAVNARYVESGKPPLLRLTFC